MIILESLNLKGPKTKDFLIMLQALKAGPEVKSVLVVTDKVEKNLKQAAGNLDFVQLELACNIHTYEVLKARKMVITQGGLKELIKRLK